MPQLIRPPRLSAVRKRPSAIGNRVRAAGLPISRQPLGNEDDRAAGRDRLPMRLWLAMPNSRALPEGHEVLWRSIEAGAVRGGIGQAAAH